MSTDAVDFSALSPLERAQQQQGTDNDLSFLEIKDGERKYFRPLFGVAPNYVVTHDCGLPLTDISKRTWDEEAAAGTPHICPVCAKPLQDSDIQYERPGIISAYMHRWVPDSAGKQSNFVCLSNDMNRRLGLVDQYDCPICHGNTDDANTKAKERYFVPVVERVIVEGDKMYGFDTQRGALSVPQDVADGTKPKISVIEAAYYKSIFYQLIQAAGSPTDLCMYDYEISRTGAKLDTQYQIRKVPILGETGITSVRVDLRQYQEYIPDIEGYLKNIGKPNYYESKGYPVSGFVPGPSQGQTQVVAQPADLYPAMGGQQPVGQPVVAQPVAAQQQVGQPVAAQPVANGAWPQPTVAPQTEAPNLNPPLAGAEMQPSAIPQPVATQPVATQPVAAQPVVGQPVATPVPTGEQQIGAIPTVDWPKTQ